MTAIPPSKRSTVRRKRDRARYDRETVHRILDEGLIAHVAAQSQQGPIVLPTAYVRIDEDLILHGATGNSLLGLLANGAPVAVAITLVDGVVLARSALHHSLNYRSVVVFGRGREITHRDSKRTALDALLERVSSGRAAQVRPPTPRELRSTRVVAIPIEEASAKVRTGPPVDDASDLCWPVWAGVIPLSVVAGCPEPA